MSDGRPVSGDSRAHRFPVSVKGVVVNAGKVVLLKNERDEWELPGGKLEPGETPEECLAREIAEEIGVSVRVGALLDTWVYRIAPGADVLIVAYGILPLNGVPLVISSEHKDIGQFTPAEFGGLRMPEEYKNSIVKWLALGEGR
jgi:mutator protein MutT